MIAEHGGEVGRARVDGLEIVYEAAGAGSPAVMLVHGAFGDRSYMAPLMAHLAGRARVVALDLRGHGESDAPAAVAVEDFETDVIAVAEDAGLERVVVCGHSMAGGVALAVAAARPDLVAGVVMLDGVVLFPPPVVAMARERLLPAIATDGWADALRGYFGRTLDPLDPPDLGPRVMADIGRARPEIARSFCTSLFGPDADGRGSRHADALAALHCPLMYVHAKAPADLGRLVELRPDAMVGQVVGSGHYLMLSASAQVNAMLDRFLEILDGSL